MSDESSREIDAMIRAAGGKRIITVMPAMSEQNRAINDEIRRAAGRLPAEPARREHPAATIGDDDNHFARTAKRLGIPADLVDIARTAIGPNADELSGAALNSALYEKAISRPARTPGRRAAADRAARRGRPRRRVGARACDDQRRDRGGIRQQRAERDEWVDIERRERQSSERAGNGL